MAREKKIVFIQEDIFPKPGAMYISSVFRRHGWQVRCLVTSQETDLAAGLKELAPAVAAFSLTSGEYAAWGGAAARLVKSVLPGCLAMLGGPHATYFPEVIEEEPFDLVCLGEGEAPAEEFCRRWEAGAPLHDIRGFWARNGGAVVRNEVCPLTEDLETIDFPDRLLYADYPFILKLSYSFVITSRGCPYRCSFCYNDSFARLFKDKGKIFRRRPVDGVIREIKELRRLFPWTRSITFADDNFWCDSPGGWLEEFSEKYGREAGLPFSCSASAGWITEKTVGLLKRAGCASVKMGIETANERVRRDILKKPATNAQIEAAAALLHRHRIKFLTYNMLGIPTETYQDALNTYELNRRLRPLLAWCSLLNPYKGTAIADIALREGCLPHGAEFSSSYFGETPLLFDRKADTVRLQKFFPVGVFLNIPVGAAGWLTRNIRAGWAYNLLFLFFYGLLIGRITGFTLRDIFIIVSRIKVFKYFGLSKR